MSIEICLFFYSFLFNAHLTYPNNSLFVFLFFMSHKARSKAHFKRIQISGPAGILNCLIMSSPFITRSFIKNCPSSLCISMRSFLASSICVRSELF